MIAAIEFGGTKTVVAIGTRTAEVIEEHRFVTTSGAATVAAAIDWIGQRGLPEAVGVAAFGPVQVDPRKADFGTMLQTPKPGWSGCAIAGALRQAFPGTRVSLDTDVNAAALAECGELEDLVYITVGTGIGAGILSGGRLVHGITHPEFGHIRVPRMAADDFAGCCPFHGDCLEGMASGFAMQKRWGDGAHALPAEHRAWEWQANYLAYGMLSLLATVCPSRIVMGGGVSKAPGLIARVENRLVELAGGYFPLPVGQPYIVPPQHGDQAGIRGALLLAVRAG